MGLAGLAGLAGRAARATRGDTKRLPRCVGPAQWLSRRTTPRSERALWHTPPRHDSHGHSHGHSHGQHDGPEVRGCVRLFARGRGGRGVAGARDADAAPTLAGHVHLYPGEGRRLQDRKGPCRDERAASGAGARGGARGRVRVLAGVFHVPRHSGA